MKKHLLLILCCFAFALNAQTIISKIPDQEIIENIESGATQFNVYLEDCKIFFSFSEELGDKENLVLDLYDANEKLIATNCVRCCQFIDLSNFDTGNYLYNIRSGNETLSSGKLLLY